MESEDNVSLLPDRFRERAVNPLGEGLRFHFYFNAVAIIAIAYLL